MYEETLFASGKFRERAPQVYSDIAYPAGSCPVAEALQPKLMQFVNNYGSEDEAAPKVDALAKTIEYLTDSSDNG